jgi:hypothetical protein
VKHESQHESRWGDKVDQQDEKNVEIKNCNWKGVYIM